MKYVYSGKILEGVFVSRPNRFIAEVDVNGKLCTCHVKNTGRMKELLLSGKKCFIREAENPNRKTKYDFISIEHEGLIVNLDSQIPNKVVEDAFLNSEIRGWEKPDLVKREVAVGDSRLDMLVEKNQERLFVEVKGVDLIKEKGHALFPDAPTTRGAKHIRELKKIAEAGGKAMVIFLLHREDAIDFRPHFELDPKFSESFYDAMDSGVEARAYTCKIGKDFIEFYKEIKILSREEAYI